MTDIASQILAIAQLAEAPRWDFRPWHASSVIQPLFQIQVPVKVLGYRVPDGYSLVITRIDSWVSVPYNGSTPGAPQPVEPVIHWPNFFTYWMADGGQVSDVQSYYTALSKGEQLFVFQPNSCAQFFIVYSGPNNYAGAEQSFSFRFNGFLTLPEHGERLTRVQSVTPYDLELTC